MKTKHIIVTLFFASLVQANPVSDADQSVQVARDFLDHCKDEKINPKIYSWKAAGLCFASDGIGKNLRSS